MSHRDVEWMIATGSKKEIIANTRLIEEGKEIDALYIVLEGQFTVSFEGRDIAELSGGEVVGEMSFITRSLPSATVTAITDSVVWSMCRQQLQEKLQQDIDFSSRFYKAIHSVMSDRLSIKSPQSQYQASKIKPLPNYYGSQKNLNSPAYSTDHAGQQKVKSFEPLRKFKSFVSFKKECLTSA
ncbi:MAG: cyclic nucleotide-binding domain-containing protein [Moorea sp. SIO4A3]|nr:cyclic nucleotide-binding domain-containing protein [Moorena sp. SIO4A3]